MNNAPEMEIRKTIRGSLPRVPFETIAKKALPRGYQLSLVICGDQLAQRMNITYRQKSYRPNVLSFPNDKLEGEIFLNVRCAAREAKKFNIPYAERLALLFAHGCLHLAGLDHGNAMESKEKSLLKAAGFIETD